MPVDLLRRSALASLRFFLSLLCAVFKVRKFSLFSFPTLFEPLRTFAIPQNDTVKSLRQSQLAFASLAFFGLTVFRLAFSPLVLQCFPIASPILAGLSGPLGPLPLSGFRLPASASRLDLGCE